MTRAYARPAVVLGICGIGAGHLYRQLPLLTALLRAGVDVMVLSPAGIVERLPGLLPAHLPGRLSCQEVVVPYLPSAPLGTGLRLGAEAAFASLLEFPQNMAALEAAYRFAPSLVISDYEPVSAQAAYRAGLPLVCLDQQHKSFLPLPEPLHGYYAQDERERLELFFPKATHRVALSFFDPRGLPGATPPPALVAPEAVTLLPPLRSPALWEAQAARALMEPGPTSAPVPVYRTGQDVQAPAWEEWLNALAPHTAARFQLVGPVPPLSCTLPAHVEVLGQVPDLPRRLASARAVLTTAGHSLLSEASFVGVPILALPLPLHEQQLSALALETLGLGARLEALTTEPLGEALDALLTLRPASAPLGGPSLHREDGTAMLHDLLAPLLGVALPTAAPTVPSTPPTFPEL